MIKIKYIEDIKKDLSENYRNDENSILDIYEEISSIASNISNRKADDRVLAPYIKRAVIATYLCRGSEGLKSSSESGVSNTYEDIVDTLRNDIIKNGLRRLK